MFSLFTIFLNGFIFFFALDGDDDDLYYMTIYFYIIVYMKFSYLGIYF